MQAAVQAITEITGESGVDYLVNNAGTAGPPVPAHEEYESVKHVCMSLGQQHCNQLMLQGLHMLPSPDSLVSLSVWTGVTSVP